jgi:hypothetical protein
MKVLESRETVQRECFFLGRMDLDARLGRVERSHRHLRGTVNRVNEFETISLRGLFGLVWFSRETILRMVRAGHRLLLRDSRCSRYAKSSPTAFWVDSAVKEVIVRGEYTEAFRKTSGRS